jgi:S1-C subfamily serine protease
VFLAINYHPISSWEVLRLFVSKLVPVSKATLKIVRDGKERTVDVTLGKVIDNPNEFLAGVDVMPLTPEVRRRLGIQDTRITGLVITSVADDSPYRDRLAASMVILEVNRSPVPDLRSAREKLVTGRNLLAVFDGRAIRFVVVNVVR